MVLLVFIFLSYSSPAFLTVTNLRALSVSMATEGIIGLGMTAALISGCFDLSVGSVFGFCTVTVAVLYRMNINIWVCCLIAIGFGCIAGFFNGMLISRLRINAFISTLATMSIFRGLCYIITKAQPIPLTGYQTKDPAFHQLGNGGIGNVQYVVIVLFVLAVIMGICMKKSEIFRKVYYTGSNENAAKLSGINTKNVILGVFLLSGALAGLVGTLFIARFGTGQPTNGEGVEMNVITAAIIGGTSLKGGSGTVVGTLLGLLLLKLINTGLVLMSVPVYWQSFVSGVMLIIAVLLDVAAQRINEKN